MKFFILLFVVLFAASAHVLAQDTLPRFSATYVGGNRVIIGWVNALGPMRQLSIQRSHDSLKNYKTILSVADPNAVQNGYVDATAPHDHMYYRIFYVRGTGEYFFTAAQKPTVDTARQNEPFPNPAAANGVLKKDSALIKNPGFVPSFYVYTNAAGDVFINLPDAGKKQYHLKFFNEQNNPVFEIKELRETGVTLDKTNFYHAGWFWFELYNEDKLVERHKFYLPKAVYYAR